MQSGSYVTTSLVEDGSLPGPSLVTVTSAGTWYDVPSAGAICQPTASTGAQAWSISALVVVGADNVMLRSVPRRTTVFGPVGPAPSSGYTAEGVSGSAMEA